MSLRGSTIGETISKTLGRIQNRNSFVHKLVRMIMVRETEPIKNFPSTNVHRLFNQEQQQQQQDQVFTCLWFIVSCCRLCSKNVTSFLLCVAGDAFSAALGFPCTLIKNSMSLSVYIQSDFSIVLLWPSYKHKQILHRWSTLPYEFW